jgi:L-asparagine oxygenase
MKATQHLTPHDLEMLRQPRFRTRLAPSFCRGLSVRPYLAPAPVLTGTPAFPMLAVDFDDTAPVDDDARSALDALHEALQATRRESVLRSGDLST